MAHHQLPADAARRRTATFADGATARAGELTIVAAIVAMAGLSGMALIQLGIPYADAGGNLLTKIHPATYLASAGVVMLAFADGGPGRYAARAVVAHPGVAAFGIATLLLLIYAGVVQHFPLSSIVDTFVLPILMFTALAPADDEQRRRIAMFLHVFLAVNAALGLFEYASGWRLVPMRDFDGSIIWDWRSTALLGHPLNNAFVTGCWLVMLAVGPWPRFSAGRRILAMVLAAASLVAFGGRTAMLVGFAEVGLVATIGGARLLAGRPVALADAVLAIAAVTVVGVAAVVLLDAGAADRLIDRFVDDSGSAGTRVAMFRIFGDLSWEEFLFAPPADLIRQAQRDYGLAIGIESSEVAFVAFYGLIMATIIITGIAAFLAELVRTTGAGAIWPVLFFAVTMSAATGLSSKSTNLALFAVMLLTMLPRGGRSVRGDG